MIATALLHLLTCLLFAQNPMAQTGGAIRGVVSHKGRGVERARVTVVSLDSLERTTLTAPDGTYSLTGLARGVYLVTVSHQTYAADESELPGGGALVEIGAREFEQVDFALIVGGVLTGVIRDVSGRPVTALRVSCVKIGGSIAAAFKFERETMTDDEGRFRLYGLPPGDYRIWTGETLRSVGKSAQPFRTAYYPGVEEESRAEVYRVTPGEVTDLGRLEVRTTRPTHSAELLFVSAETGALLSSLEFDLLMTGAAGATRQTFKTDETGRVKVENLSAGRYMALPAISNRRQLVRHSFSPTAFDVTDADVRDLIIKCDTETGSVSGEVRVDDSRPATLLDCAIALKEGDDLTTTDRPTYQVKLNPDGTFHLSGLRRTVYTLVVLPLRPALRYESAAVGGQIFREPGYYGKLRIDAGDGPQQVRVNLAEIGR